ncbi:hypothetical protein [Scytonema sp. NUACC26]|uniref:hypothetical protein n=1 Tax=Scytonema sp. NUACC26 TaxID=3140176 RepID=UPI0034DC08D1
MNRSSTVAAVAFTLLGLSLTDTSAKAQTTYTFNATYEVSSTSVPITPNVSATTISGESTDAPYGLSQVSGSTYTQIDLTTGSFRFNTDPATFSLPNLPQGKVALFGSSGNRLFGTNDATGVIDFTTLTGSATNIYTIAGGEVLFLGATGILTLAETYQLSFDPNIPTTGIARVTGTVEVPFTQKVPEPDNTIALIGTMTSAFVLYRQHRKATVR